MKTTTPEKSIIRITFLISLILPLGLILLWKDRLLDKRVKVILTILSPIYTILLWFIIYTLTIFGSFFLTDYHIYKKNQEQKEIENNKEQYRKLKLKFEPEYSTVRNSIIDTSFIFGSWATETDKDYPDMYIYSISIIEKSWNGTEKKYLIDYDTLKVFNRPSYTEYKIVKTSENELILNEIFPVQASYKYYRFKKGLNLAQLEGLIKTNNFEASKKFLDTINIVSSVKNKQVDNDRVLIINSFGHGAYIKYEHPQITFFEDNKEVTKLINNLKKSGYVQQGYKFSKLNLTFILQKQENGYGIHLIDNKKLYTN